MPALEYPDEATIESWDIRERGPRDGSSPNETLEVDASTATRTFMCKWENRLDFAKWMVGYSALWDDSGTIRLSRLLPQRHPHPDLQEWACTKITRISGHQFAEWDGVNGVNVFTDAIVECFYEHVPYALLEDGDITTEFDRYVSWPIDAEPESQHLQLPGSTLKYVADPVGPHAGSAIDGKTIPFNVGKVIPGERFSVKWHRLPEDAYKPGSALYDRLYGLAEGDDVPFIGTINKDDGFLGRPSGTILMESAKAMKRRSPTGEGWEYDVMLNVKFRPSGWNWAWGMQGTSPTATHNDYYMASATGTFATADTVADFDSAHNARTLGDLFDVDPP